MYSSFIYSLVTICGDMRVLVEDQTLSVLFQFKKFDVNIF